MKRGVIVIAPVAVVGCKGKDKAPSQGSAHAVERRKIKIGGPSVTPVVGSVSAEMFRAQSQATGFASQPGCNCTPAYHRQHARQEIDRHAH